MSQFDKTLELLGYIHRENYLKKLTWIIQTSRESLVVKETQTLIFFFIRYDKMSSMSTHQCFEPHSSELRSF